MASDSVEALRRALEGGFPAVSLLHGEDLQSARETARSLCAALLCDRGAPGGEACGDCADCRLHAANSHPDHMELQPAQSGRAITVAQARMLVEFIAVTAHRGGRKTALIDPGDALSASASNALLKSLEEPPPGCHALIVSAHPQQMPATLRSRCHKHFFPAQSSRASPLDERVARGWHELLAGDRDPCQLAEALHEEDDVERVLSALSTAQANCARTAPSLPRAASMLRCMEETLRVISLRRGGFNPGPQMLFEGLLIRCRRILGAPRQSR